ncbi:hypothetical protein T484DRAFT_1847216 [Baffinella frigidus]|nr:hypothetical protein T484DRAFT_1847216 [Cryptophyta sp. CCMP2293]
MQQTGRASPPPQGMMMDEDEAHTHAVPTLVTHTSHGEGSLEKSTIRTERLVTQVHKWRALLLRDPHDPLSHFWAEQVATLEARLARTQAPGSKRARDTDEWGADAMEDGVWGHQKRVALPGLAPPPRGNSPNDTTSFHCRR